MEPGLTDHVEASVRHCPVRDRMGVQATGVLLGLRPFCIHVAKIVTNAFCGPLTYRHITNNLA